MVANMLLHQHSTSVNRISSKGTDLILKKLFTEISDEEAAKAMKWCFDKGFCDDKHPLFRTRICFKKNMNTNLQEENDLSKIKMNALGLFLW